MHPDPVVQFEVANVPFAIARRWVLRVVAVPRLAIPPSAPAVLAGLLDDAGEPVCVLRFRSLIGANHAEQPGLYDHVILLRDLGTRFALLVDRVNALMFPEADTVKKVPSGVSLRDCVKAEIGAEGGPVQLVDPECLVSDFERESVAHFVEEERRRREAFSDSVA